MDYCVTDKSHEVEREREGKEKDHVPSTLTETVRFPSTGLVSCSFGRGLVKREQYSGPDVAQE